MIPFNLYALCRRQYAWLMACRPAFLALAGFVLLATTLVNIYRLEWPPSDTGTWRLASPLIAIATVAGWLLLMLALKLTPRPAAWPCAPDAGPLPSSYRDMLGWSARLVLRRLAWVVVGGAGLMIVPAAFFDLVSPLLTGILLDLPWYSFTSHNLYAMALLATDPRILAFLGALLLPVLMLDRFRCFWPANDQDHEHLRLASIANPTVQRYRVELERLGRRMVIEDVERLGSEIWLNRMVDHARQ